ncbi:MAG: hypothetical protein K5766_02945 [Alphaproteobacteria bacterium]|nr:hypothetical protein [Alphaproteobacteria bacterium]MCR4555743.1 hypothetical protein [Alphaproteobacteria bacterium]
MSQFFLKDDPGLFEEKFEEKIRDYKWLISADKIFSSKIEKFTDFAELYHIEYMIYKSFLYDQTKTAESSVYAKEVHIYMSPGIHCAMLQGRMAKSVIIPKITINKVKHIEGKLSILEKKEFKQCMINAFGLRDDTIGFSFRYTSLNDSYNKFNPDNTSAGNAGVQIDFVKWEVKSS